MNDRKRDASTNLIRLDGTGVIHAAAMSGNKIGLRVLFCNGRAVRGYFGSASDVTCKACLKALKARGQEPTVTAEVTHESQWGREPITVDALVPTRAITHHLGKVNVGTPLEDVLADTAEEIVQASMGPEGDLWTAKRIAQTLLFTEWQHLENRAEYAAVMGASL